MIWLEAMMVAGQFIFINKLETITGYAGKGKIIFVKEQQILCA